MKKITDAEYEEFLKHYAWLLLKNPNYRLGQAFLNYFPEISQSLVRYKGTLEEFTLFNETDPARVQPIIDQWRQL